MDWRPLRRDELHSTIERELAHCSDELRAYFVTVAFEPAKWRQSPYGDEGGGFWAIAADGGRVLWFNDIEEGLTSPRLWSGDAADHTGIALHFQHTSAIVLAPLRPSHRERRVVLDLVKALRFAPTRCRGPAGLDDACAQLEGSTYVMAEELACTFPY